ncbi:MAG: TIGR00266 family protein [Proteobacteria bacterium]|nr:TIGR00266 family protein [Pseudomonadota bacterium]MBU1686493.1 TIGR00266 family protein [Pseudomonadota bacterium]
MANWFAASNGKSLGPYTTQEMINALQSGRFTREMLVWREGFSSWLAIEQVDELSGQVSSTEIHQPPTPPPTEGKKAHEIDFEIIGNEMQFVEIELDPGESAVAEAGAMVYMTDGVEMKTVFGDGSAASQSGGIFNKLLGAGQRLITGESLFCTIFTYKGSSGKGKIAFGSPYPGKIIPLDLTNFHGRLICQKDAFLCAAKGVSIGIAFQKRIGAALFGGEGFIMQKLEGDGLVFIHAGGTIVEKQLARGETLRVDTGCLAALTDTIRYDIEYVGNVTSGLFGGEGFFYASLTGPGHVWLQSLPFSRLAGRIHRAAPQNRGGASTVGEGSVLGGLGKLFQE